MIHSGSRVEQVQIQTQTGSFRVAVPVNAANDFAVNVGGGLRYYLAKNAGVRFEYKAYKPTGVFTNVFSKVEVGLYWHSAGKESSRISGSSDGRK